jgi:hypothetical protein
MASALPGDPLPPVRGHGGDAVVPQPFSGALPRRQAGRPEAVRRLRRGVPFLRARVLVPVHPAEPQQQDVTLGQFDLLPGQCVGHLVGGDGD